MFIEPGILSAQETKKAINISGFKRKYLKYNGSSLHDKILGAGFFDNEMLLEKGNNFGSRALIQYYQAVMIRTEQTNFLTSTRVLVLFVTGRYDRTVPECTV